VLPISLTKKRTYNERNGEEKLADYKIKHNTTSIDGLPGVKTM
jgi:hypothetical protein